MQDQLIGLLQDNLNPNLVGKAHKALNEIIVNQGVLTNLLIISDNTQIPMNLRQMSLIFLKNAVQDYSKGYVQLPQSDVQTLKNSILQALIRNCQDNMLTPTLKEIIYYLADKQIPYNWPQITPQIIFNIESSGDFNEIYASVWALKAIVSAFQKKINQTINQANLYKKITIPLLALASKLFQNYNQTTSLILISVFKIFSIMTYSHLHDIVKVNIHNFMIFIKKLLDLNIESTNIDKNMYDLKKICLRILYRIYQRHLNRRVSQCQYQFIVGFHQKFTRGVVETLLLQIMNEAALSKNSKNQNFLQLTRYSLLCLAYIYRQDRQSAILIDNYRQKIIFLCVQRYKKPINQTYSNVSDLKYENQLQRSHFCDLIMAFMENQTKKQQIESKGIKFDNREAVSFIMGILFDYIQKGNYQIKEVCLYIFSRLANVVLQLVQNIQQQMLHFIVNYVKPFFKQNSPLIIKLRCCQIISKYSYVDIPESQLGQFGQCIYGCLISQSNQVNNMIMRVHAAQAFNSLLKYDSIVISTSPFLANILACYTQLLQTQTTVMKYLEDLLQKYQKNLQPFGNDLIALLINMYFQYNEFIVNQQQIKSQNNSNRNSNNNKSSYNNNDEDNQSQSDENQEDANYFNACKACLASIRQILQVQNLKLQRQKEDLLNEILVSIFSDKEQLHIEQGFNILNLILCKQTQVNQNYNAYFVLIIYGIVPIPDQIVKIYQNQNDNFSINFINMLKNICSVPDQDFIQNTVGCLRNFISKFKQNLRNNSDIMGNSFLNLLFQAVKSVHQISSRSQSEKSIILTIFISLLEWGSVNQVEAKSILCLVQDWLRMEVEAVQQMLQSQKKQNQQSTKRKQSQIKIAYSPIYLQIILLGSHFYPNVVNHELNCDWIFSQVLENWQKFKCDYQLSRLLIGISDMLSDRVIKNQNICSQLLNRLPDAVFRICKIRNGQCEDQMKSIDDQAEEQKYFGEEQNTHMIGWNKQSTIRPQNLIQNSNNGNEDMEQEDEEQDVYEQFNKFYQSPLDKIDQILYLSQALKGKAIDYMSFMNVHQQESLSNLILNAPGKFNQKDF